MYKKLIFPYLVNRSLDDGEVAHEMMVRWAQRVQKPWLLHQISKRYNTGEDKPVTIGSVTFPHAVGIAAGLDKQGQMLPLLEAIGAGFVTVGTVTPRPQAGNPRPRLLRLPTEYQGLWNWMGFNGDGAVAIARRLTKVRSSVSIPIGVSLGKQRDTSLDNTERDYRTVLAEFDDADYIEVNVSSPNTLGLRDLQGYQYLYQLVGRVVVFESVRAERVSSRPRPVLVKLAPDLIDEEFTMSIEAIDSGGASGLIIGNTSVKPPSGFEPLSAMRDIAGTLKGGYSGPHQIGRTVERVRFARKRTTLPIIACGGISECTDICMLREAGATMFQVFTSLVYQGPELITRLRTVA